VKLAEANDEL